MRTSILELKSDLLPIVEELLKYDDHIFDKSINYDDLIPLSLLKTQLLDIPEITEEIAVEFIADPIQIYCLLMGKSVSSYYKNKAVINYFRKSLTQ